MAANKSGAVSEFAGKSRDSCVACSWNTFLWIPSCPKHPRAGLPAVQLGALKMRSKLLSREFSGSGLHIINKPKGNSRGKHLLLHQSFGRTESEDPFFGGGCHSMRPHRKDDIFAEDFSNGCR